MAWFKVDDGLHSSRKLLSIPRRHRLAALGLWTISGSWSSSELTDGVIPDYMIDEWGGTKVLADWLVKSGLWRKLEVNYSFHNWGEYQPTKADVEAGRQKNAEKLRLWRERNRGVTEGVTGLQDGSNPVRNPAPDPTRPDPKRRDSQSVSGSPVTRDDEPPMLETSIPRHVLPASWGPNTAHQAYAIERGVDINHELRQFKAHCRSQRKTSLDFDAEFDKWLGNARTPNTGRSSDRQGDILKAERAAAIAHDAMTGSKEITA